MFINKLGEDSPIPNFIHLKIRRRDGVESLTTIEKGKFKVPIDGCIKQLPFYVDLPVLRVRGNENWWKLNEPMIFMQLFLCKKSDSLYSFS